MYTINSNEHAVLRHPVNIRKDLRNTHLRKFDTYAGSDQMIKKPVFQAYCGKTTASSKT